MQVGCCSLTLLLGTSPTTNTFLTEPQRSASTLRTKYCQEARFIRLGKVQVGTKVKVREDYRIPELRGMIGTVVKTYGRGKRRAVHVSSEDGLWQLFRPEELEKLGETTSINAPHE
jgi:hypothetical protein